MKIPPGWRDADALTKRIPDKGLHASMFGTGWPRGQGGNRRVCAVSFLNTTPLVWGMLHGPQKGIFELDFRVPSGCAEQLASGAADIGIVPSFELTRQDLEVIPGVGIACHGAARSILLVSSRPAARIRTLAVDSSSRTDRKSTRLILNQRYGAEPVMTAHAPDLEAMLRVADAALIIGDPALIRAASATLNMASRSALIIGDPALRIELECL